MWTSSKPRTSRTPVQSVSAKEKADVISVTTPLYPSATSPDSRVQPTAEDSTRRSGFCCCGRPQRRRNKDRGEKVKADSHHQDGSDHSYTLTSTRKGSGITGLSQLSEIPRYDSDTDLDTTPPNMAPTTTAASSTTTKTNSNLSGSQKNSQDENRRCQKCGTYFRRFIRVFFSLVGLTIFIVGYSIGGAFLFTFLETDCELQIRQDVGLMRGQAVHYLWNVTEHLNVLHEQEWKKMADTVLTRFQQDVYAMTQRGWDGAEEGEKPTSWTFFSSLLYCLTVLTTIGYGNVTPKTMLGRYTTIAYAVIGIPICLMWLAMMGRVMATAFRFLYKHVCNLCLCLCCKSSFRKRRLLMKEKQRETEEAILAESGQGGSGGKGRGRGGGDGEKSKEKRVRVPIYLSLLTLLLYIVLGAVLFSTWEGWEFSVAAYFCFVTLSTIGFGDYVPGFGTDMSQGKTIGNAAYLIIGLALLAMCFNLMQEEVSIMFQKMAKKVASWTTDSSDKESSARAKRKKKAEARRHRSMDELDSYAERRLIKEDLVSARPKLIPASRAPYTSKSTHTLVDMGSEENLDTMVHARRTRLYTVSGVTGRYAPMPQATLVSRGGVRSPTSSSSNNNNDNINNKNRAGSSLSEQPSMTLLTRPASVPPQALPETVDLLEHMNLVRQTSPQPSPKILRRDRSRSPVRGRSKSRGPGSEDRGGNVDVATEDEDNDDDDDTLDAESVASSTDLIKVAHALRRERSEQSSRPSSPSHTMTSEDVIPSYTHLYNNGSMTTFRPSPTGGCAAGGGGGIPGPQTCTPLPTTSRPQSRCQSRARSTSPSSSSFYHQGCDLLPSSRPSSVDGEGEGEDERESVYGDGDGGECVDSPEVLSRSAFSKPRPPSAAGARLHEQQDMYSYTQQQQQQRQQQLQQQQRQQQHQQQRQQQLRQQQRQQQLQQQQYQQEHQQQQAQKQANKIHSSENFMPPRCVSPRPRPPKTPQHKVAPPPYAPVGTVTEVKKQPPPTLPKSKKMPVVAQPL